MNLKPLAPLLLLAGCATQPRVDLLFGVRRLDGETEPGAELRVSQDFGKHGTCQATHSSDPHKGQPFNDKDELNVETGMCGWTFGGQRRR